MLALTFIFFEAYQYNIYVCIGSREKKLRIYPFHVILREKQIHVRFSLGHGTFFKVGLKRLRVT